MSGSMSSGNYIGSGSDTITLNMSEDQALGVDAVFTLNVDGQQIGGPQTVTAQRSAGQDQTFTFAGDFNPGHHNVTVTFANNFIYPGLSGDRNVYVDGVTYDGQTVSNTTTPIYQSPWFPPNSTVGNVYGNAVFSVNDTTSVPAGASSTSTTTPGPVSDGSGPDTLVLNMAEDPYMGDAQFTVAVDGKQLGGLYTTSANVSEGQQQEFDLKGNFGGGNHTVTVNFTNDLIGGYYPDGTPFLPPGQRWALDTEDRNLYVMSASINGGAPTGGAPWEQSSSGSHDYYVSSGSNPSAGNAAPTTSDTAAITTSSLSTPSSSDTSSSGMSFMASPTTTSMMTTDSSSMPTTTGSSGNTTSNAASTVVMMTPTTQDFSVPTTTLADPTMVASTSTSGSGGSSMAAQMAAMQATHTHHHQNA